MYIIIFLFYLMHSENSNKEEALQVICLGLFRCATHSLKIALETLGYSKCYHFFEFHERKEDEKVINELCEGKSPDLINFFQGYKSVSDVPFALFYEELYKQFPKAKFILNWRDPEKWWESSIDTVYDEGKVNQPHTKEFVKYMWNSYFNKEFTNKEKAIEVFKKHFDNVRKLIPKEQLLEYEIKEEWAPLCKFLNKDIPNIAFPRSNAKEEFQRENEKIITQHYES